MEKGDQVRRLETRIEKQGLVERCQALKLKRLIKFSQKTYKVLSKDLSLIKIFNLNLVKTPKTKSWCINYVFLQAQVKYLELRITYILQLLETA